MNALQTLRPVSLAALACIVSCSAPASPSGAPLPVNPSAPRRQAPPEDVARLVGVPTGVSMAYQVGAPRLRLAAGTSYGLGVPVAVGGGLVAAADGEATVAVWDLSSGKLLRRVFDPERVAARALHLILSETGRYLAIRFANRGYLLRKPFTGAATELPCAPYDFSDDEDLLLCDEGGPKIVDLATMRTIAEVQPSTHTYEEAWGLAFSQDERAVFWAHKRGVLRWDVSAGGKLTQVFSVPSELIFPAFARKADAALFVRDRHAYRADLRTGKVSAPLPEAGLSYAITPSGREITLLQEGGYVSLDADTALATALFTAPGAEGKLTFGTDERSAVFVAKVPSAPGDDARELRVFEQGRGLRSYAQPTRFAGWTEQGQAVLAGTPKSWLLAPASDERTAAPPGGRPERPPWALEWATAPWPLRDGSLVYLSHTNRATTLPHLRLHSPCEEMLRVARPQGVATIATSFKCPSKESELMSELEGSDLSEERFDRASGSMHLGWFVGTGWLLEAMTDRLALRDATGAVRRVQQAPIAGPDEAPADGRFWSFAFSRDGARLAVIWRRLDFGSDNRRRSADDESRCVRLQDSCQWEYYLELWSLEQPLTPGTVPWDWPKRLWRERLTGAAKPGQPPTVKAPFGPLVFDATGKRLFVGFADGDVLLRTVRGHTPATDDATPIGPLVSMHQLAVTKLVPSPDGQWMFSEDVSTEQRLWRLPGPGR